MRAVYNKLIKVEGLSLYHAGYFAAIRNECMVQARMDKRHQGGKLVRSFIERARWANKQSIYFLSRAKDVV